MYRLHYRELTILGRERQLHLYKDKDSNYWNQSCEIMQKSWFERPFIPIVGLIHFWSLGPSFTTWEAHVFSLNENGNRKLGKVIFLQIGSWKFISNLISLFLKFPIKNEKHENSQFFAQKDTKVSIWKFTSVLKFYNVNSQLEVWLNHPINSPLSDWVAVVKNTVYEACPTLI